jgi:uncharacterized protein
VTDALSIHAISDLHLFSAGARPGLEADGLEFTPIWPHLIDHWYEVVEPGDWVLIPGDISDSWPQIGLHADYRFLDKLPGRKLLSPGNHDHPPWHSQVKVGRFCREFERLDPVVSGARRLAIADEVPGLVVVAGKGACAPGDDWFAGELSLTGPENATRRFELELARLRRALAAGQRLRQPEDRLLVQLHYPPRINFSQPSPFSELIEAAGVDVCIFGHLHAAAEHEAVTEGPCQGTNYRLVAAPILENQPLTLGQLTRDGISWSI